MKTYQEFLYEAGWARIAALAAKRGRAFLKPGPKSGSVKPPLGIKMVGMPGSGKSTAAAALAKRTGGTAYGYDHARAALYGNRATQGNFFDVHDLTVQQLRNAPRDKPRILDNTNVNPMFKQSTDDALRNQAGFDDVVSVATDTTQRRSFARNANRDQPVPRFVMRTMAAQEKQFRKSAEGKEAIRLYRELAKKYRLRRRTPTAKLGLQPRRGIQYPTP